MSSNIDSATILRGPDDWDKWDRQFRAKAVASSLWEQIYPDAPNPKAFLTEPEEPRLSDYPGTRESPAREGESSHAPGRRLRQ